MSLKTVCCRLCLSMDGSMRDITNSPLQDVYEKLTSVSEKTVHLPVVACYLCYSQLRKSHHMMVRAARADKVLAQILRHGDEVKEKLITVIKEHSCLQLNNTLNVTPVELNAFTGTGDSSIKTEIKENSLGRKENTEISRPSFVERFKFEESDDDEDMKGEPGADKSRDNEDQKPEIKEETPDREVETGRSSFASRLQFEESDDDKDIEGPTKRNYIKTEVLDDVRCDKSEESREDLLRGQLEEVYEIDSDESEDTAPSKKCKQPRDENPDSSRNTPEDNTPVTNIATIPFEIVICQPQELQKQHLKKDSTITERPIECRICHRRFTREQYYQAHYRTHMGEKSYKCDICQQRFAHSFSKTHHLKTHLVKRPLEHVKTDYVKKQAAFECGKCRKRFDQTRELSQHIKRGECIMIKPFECGMCRERFTETKHLTQHLACVHSWGPRA